MQTKCHAEKIVSFTTGKRGGIWYSYAPPSKWTSNHTSHYMPKLIQKDHRFKCKEEAIRLLKENVAEFIATLNFLYMTPKAWCFQQICSHQNWWLLFESYFEANEKISHGLGKIFASNVSDKGLVSKVYNDLSNLNNKKTTPFLK